LDEVDAERDESERLIAELRTAVERGDPTDPILAAHSLSAAVHALVEFFNSGEYDLMAFAVPGHNVHDMRPTGFPGLGVYDGRDEYTRFLREWVDAFPDAHLEVQLMHETPERNAIFGVVQQEVRGGTSELPMSFQYAFIAERSPEQSNSAFSLDLEGLREEFVAKHGQDPGPIPARRESRQEA
jgi:hypothetical protein